MKWNQRRKRLGFLNTLTLFKNLTKKNILINLYYKKKNIYLRSNTTDFAVFYSIYCQDHYDLEYDFDPKFIIDGGANIGISSLYFAEKFPKSRVIAIEPEKSNYEILLKNIKGFKNITPMKKGLWYKSTYLKITNPNVPKYAFQVEEINNNRNETIDGITINELLANSGFPHIDILKLDIEGAEKYLFNEKSLQWLDKVNVIIIEMHEFFEPGCSKILFDALVKLDYYLEVHSEDFVIRRKEILRHSL